MAIQNKDNKSSSNIPICQQPWFEMQIEYNKLIGCCCYYQYRKSYWDLKSKFDVESYWNNDFFRTVRDIVATKKLKDTGCYDCGSLKYDMNTNLFSEIPNDLNTLQKENFLKATQNFTTSKIVVDHYPVKYYLNCGLLCNIRCFMCSQQVEREINKTLLPYNLINDLTPYLPYANEICFIGGEPFLLPNVRYFLETITNNPDLSNLKVSMVSNGTLIHKHLDLLKKIKRLNISFSIDATGDAYESIRIGAKWDDVQRNVLNLIDIAYKNNYSWSFGSGTIIMKRTLPHLIDTIKWHITHDIPLGFSNLCTQDFTVEENIIEYPELLASIPQWQDIFDESLELLISKKWTKSAQNLKSIKNQIFKNATKRFPQLLDKTFIKSKRLQQQTIRVSIITICLNAMPHIKDCIESILAQDYPNIEYIIQDGGSTDGTVEIIKQYAEKYPDKIKWASEKDSGHGEAMNRALQRCTGEIIGTCNADDVLMPYAVRWAVESFDANREVGAIFGDYVTIDERGNTRSLVISGLEQYNYERIICVEDVIPMQSAFFRRSALKEAGLLNGNWLPRHCEDFTIWVRLGLKAKIKQLRCFVSKYRIHKGSETYTPKVYKKFYIAKRETLERFFLDPQVPQSIKALRNRAMGGLALSIAGMFLIHFGNVQEAFSYIRLARAEQPDNAHLLHLGQTIRKWDFALLKIIKYAQDLFFAQKYEEAYAVFDLLTLIDLWYPGLHYLRAVCLQMLGRNTDAVLALKREFELHPDFEVPNPEFFGLERG